MKKTFRDSWKFVRVENYGLTRSRSARSRRPLAGRIPPPARRSAASPDPAGCLWYLARLKTTQPTSLGVFVHALAFSASPYQTGLSVLVYRALVMNTATTVGVRAIRGYSEEKDQTAANA